MIDEVRGAPPVWCRLYSNPSDIQKAGAKLLEASDICNAQLGSVQNKESPAHSGDIRTTSEYARRPRCTRIVDHGGSVAT
jgi:hypothetical protein